MTDVLKLKVSLTKHGAHKVATLLRMYHKDEVLNHVWGKAKGIKVDGAQARVNMSARLLRKDVPVPKLWNEVRKLGDQQIDALVLLAIVFSHHSLIEALQAGASGDSATGTVKRGEVLDGKAFTNFAHVIEQLGYSIEHKASHVRFDFTRMFGIEGLNKLALELFELKLKEARWDGKSQVVDELVANDFHRALAVSADFFRKWLTKGVSSPPAVVIDEDGFFAGTDSEDADTAPGAFKFVPGHTPKKKGSVPVSPRSVAGKALLLHNAMQDSLYSELVKQHGGAHVRTEQPTGNAGTSIDVVVKTASFCWFYEIKTAKSVKACIRQAIPQLLEYAYWHGGTDRCDRLIIVGRSGLTKHASAYLAFLRKTFGLELHYLQHKV
ncbi:MAG: hypothetical protein V4787_26595 [Pseudomonadota bacterium]